MPKKPSKTKKPKKIECDFKIAAEEVKKFLDSKKFDLIDYGYVDIECYPPVDPKEYPHLCALRDEWEAMFDYADKVTQDDGSGFPEDRAKCLEEKCNKIGEIVNEDREYWDKLRAIVIPLYEKSPHFEDWKQRWQSIEFVYDPIGMDVTTTQMWTNKETGERIRGEVVRSTSYPAGFIVRVN